MLYQGFVLVFYIEASSSYYIEALSPLTLQLNHMLFIINKQICFMYLHSLM